LIGRELLCKTTEQVYFAADFLLGHLIQFALALPLLLPRIDRLHTKMLLWAAARRPPTESSTQQQRQVYMSMSAVHSTSQDRRRLFIIRVYSLLFALVFLLTIGLMIFPKFAGLFINI
jgi:1,3-beta-glucan synthase